MRQLSPVEIEAIVIRVTKNPDIFVMVYTNASKTQTTILNMAREHKIATLDS